MVAPNLLFKGMRVEDVYTNITRAGVSEAEAATIVGSWIYENIGRSRRTFNYATAFPAEDAACAPTFNRSFQHQDWIDGESVVQAEETVGEEGFNVRFHHIEEDLDAVGADVAQLFGCLAAMRRDLRVLLDEIRTEVNRINADIHTCCNEPRRPRFPIFDFDTAVRPEIDFEYVDTMKFLDKYVQVFKSDKGLFMLPAIEQITVHPAADPRIQRAAKLGRFIEEDARVREAFPGGLTKDAFLERFGREELADGRRVRQLVDVLPPGAEYGSVDAMLDDVATREAAALRTSDTGDASIVAAFGVGVDVGNVADAPVERFATIPEAARTALVTAGITTMGELAKAEPRRVAVLLEREGVAAGVGDAAEWVAGAKALQATR
jgi:hypothetical protein